jgi:hypothetical protein
VAIADALALAGLALTVLGAILTASNLPAKPWILEPGTREAREELIRHIDHFRRMGYVSPPYSPEAVEAALAEADRLLAGELKRLQSDHVSAVSEDQWKRRKAALWGVLSIALGSMSQGVAVLLS